jgi:hypothetical protein
MNEAELQHMIEAIDAALLANHIEQERLHKVIIEAQWQSELFRRQATQAEDNLIKEERSAANLEKQRRELLA